MLAATLLVDARGANGRFVEARSLCKRQRSCRQCLLRRSVLKLVAPTVAILRLVACSSTDAQGADACRDAPR